MGQNIQDNIVACVENQVEKEFVQEKTFFFFLRKPDFFFCFEHEKKNLEMYFLLLSQFLYLCLEENKRNEMIRFCMRETGETFG